MLETVDTGERSLASYRGIAPEGTLDELARLAEDLRGARVLHLNATPYGGGVSELLRSVVPLLNDLGLVADWKIISGDSEFFQVTKAMHNGLQGGSRSLSEREREIYRSTSEQNAAALEEAYDFVFVHDPQPAAILSLRGKDSAAWVWRCHIDTAEPNPDTWSFLREFLGEYDSAVFTLDDFVPPNLPVAHVQVIPPAIDPLSPKNRPLDEATAREILAWLGVSLDRPLITQISRFDPWKDPLGVIRAYRLAREQVPNLQLVLAGSMAMDDPEGWSVYHEIMNASAADPLVHVFTNLTGVGNIEVNALQRLSSVVVQKSLREGFGLVVSEALWKGTPVVAGRAGGIPLQMADGAGGILVDTVEECAEGMLALLESPDRAAELAGHGRERVRRRFLLPRLLLNELSLMLDLSRNGAAKRVPVTSRPDRDPVCGMVVSEQQAPRAQFRGHAYVFCSEYCHRRFLERPDRYAIRISG